MNRSRELMDLFSQNNLSCPYLDGLLSDSVNGMGNLNYNLIRDNYKIIESQVNLAINVKENIEELTEFIASLKEKGINIDEVERLLNLAILSFERNDFEEANKRISEALVSYNSISSDQIEGEESYSKTSSKNIFPVFFLVLVLIFIICRVIFIVLVNRKIRFLHEEGKILERLVILVEKRCFEEKKMSMDEYQSAMMNYNDRILNVIQNLVNLRIRKKNLFGIAGKSKLLLEEKRIISKLIARADKDLEKKRLDKRTYELKLKGYNNRLSKIEKELTAKEGRGMQEL